MPKGSVKNKQFGQKIHGTDAKALKTPYGAKGLSQKAQRPKKAGGQKASIGSGSQMSYEPHKRMRLPRIQPGEMASAAKATLRKDIAQPYQEQRIHDAISARVGPYKGVHVQPYNVGQYGKSGFIGGLELAARKKLGNRGF